MNRHSDLLKLLLPPVAYDRTDVALTAEVNAIGTQLDVVQTVVTDLLVELDPRTASALLPEWEASYGLPDECYADTDTVADRRLRLAGKVAETGGISKPYFLNLATQLGYHDVSITRFTQTTCEMSCEDALYDGSWLFAWQVNIPGQQTIHQYFGIDSSCEDPLDSYKQGPLECLLLRLNPGDAVVLFNYEET